MGLCKCTIVRLQICAVCCIIFRNRVSSRHILSFDWLFFDLHSGLVFPTAIIRLILSSAEGCTKLQILQPGPYSFFSPRPQATYVGMRPDLIGELPEYAYVKRRQDLEPPRQGAAKFWRSMLKIPVGSPPNTSTSARGCRVPLYS